MYSPKQLDDILTLDLETGIESTVRFGTVGSPKYFSKTLVAAQACEALIVERDARDSKDSLFYLYNFVTKKIGGSFRNSALGEFFVLSNRELILINEYQLTMGAAGMEAHHAGRIHVIRFSGEEMGVVNVPKEGEIVHVATGGTTAFYSAPNSISIVNLADLSARSLEIPFYQCKVAVWKPAR